MAVDRQTKTTLATLMTLKRQFEAGASQYHRLNHLLAEAPHDQPHWLCGPFPVEGCRQPNQALGTCFPSAEISFRIQGTEPQESRIVTLSGRRVFQFHAIYVSGSFVTETDKRTYSVGRDQFVRLAERAGECLLSLPPDVINIYPPEWAEYEQYLKPQLFTKIEPSGDSANPQIQTVERTYDAILPLGSKWSDRWCGFLHWLAWQGEDGAILKASRNTWSGNTTLPWMPTRADHAKFMSVMPPLANFPFETTRHFYSVLDGVFLCSALAIDMIETRMSLSSDPATPARPRPPDPEIDRVYPDLAKALSDAGVDGEGARSLAVSALEEILTSSGHSPAAIDWALRLACQRGLLRNGVLKEKQVRTIRRGVSEAKPRIVDVNAVSATDDFWNAWKSGAFMPRVKEVILLVHGIRTFAEWQPMVKRVLEEIPNTQVTPIKYGFLDAIRFWSPLFWRNAAINDVRREIQNAKAGNPEARLSIISHSFGTFAMSQILLEHPDIRLHRLILSGSIVPRRYRWDYVRSRLDTDVINDYGTRDVWPVFAQCLSWGYGDTGRHGFGRGAMVRDRGHDYAHSDFFNEEFVRTYWKPWFEENRFEPSAWAEKAPPTRWILNVISVLPLQWILLAALLMMVGLVGYLLVARLFLGFR